MRSTWLMAVLLAVLLVPALAGCGGGDAAAPSSAKAGTRPDAPPARSSDPHDALIRAADLSSSWTASSAMGSPLACDGWDPLRGSVHDLESQHFRRAPIDIQQTLAIFSGDAASARAYRRLDAARTERCVRKALRTRMRFASGGGTAFVTPVTVVRDEPVGKHSDAIRYAAQVNGEIARGTAYIVTINSRAGRAAASLTVYAGIAQLAEAAYDELAAAQEKRLDAVFD